MEWVRDPATGWLVHETEEDARRMMIIVHDGTADVYLWSWTAREGWQLDEMTTIEADDDDQAKAEVERWVGGLVPLW